MSKKLISITKNSKIKYLRGAFKIGRDSWKVNISKNFSCYFIGSVHSWQSYQIDNQAVMPGYLTTLVTPEHWFYEHCVRWVKHQEVLNYNKSIKAALKKLD